MRVPTILRYVSILYRYSQMYLASRLKPLHSSVGLYPFMLAICRRPGMNQEGLSEILVMDKGTTAKAVKNLERKGYIVRESDQTDRRTNRLYPTAPGEEFRDKLDVFLLEWKEILWKDFSASERTQSCDLIRRMAANARAHVVEAREGAIRQSEWSSDSRCVHHGGYPSLL